MKGINLDTAMTKNAMKGINLDVSIDENDMKDKNATMSETSSQDSDTMNNINVMCLHGRLCCHGDLCSLASSD